MARSNDALPLATRMETRLPWRPTRGSLPSLSYLVRNRTLGPPYGFQKKEKKTKLGKYWSLHVSDGLLSLHGTPLPYIH